MSRNWLAAVAGLLIGLNARAGGAAMIWVEGEKPARSTMHRHPWWYDQVQRDQLSGGDLISNFHKEPGEASYRVAAPSAGPYDLWVRANPVASRMSYRVNDGPWMEIALEKQARDQINVALDRKIDLRFLAWAKAGRVALRKGENTVAFRMDSANSNHGFLDCFVLTDEPFLPRGALRPGDVPEATRRALSESKGWFAFDPPPDPFAPTSGFDLRALNEKEAGEGGFIGVKGSQFVHKATGRPVRFWAVNGPSSKDPDELRREARMLARRGVNLVRVHGSYYRSEDGAIEMEKVRHAFDVVEAMKAEGIYCHFSIYFPLWLTPKPGLPWLDGYDGKRHPFAALSFNKDFQAKYRDWWRALLLTPFGKSGRRLIDDPAVAGAEIINEDSYFFWTFNGENLPDAQLRIIEAQFGDWLKARHGSIPKAVAAWGGGPAVARDKPAEGRVGFRPLWNLANEKTRRDQDTARFLFESQSRFYRETVAFLREIGFRGVVTASNWTTASAEVLGPLEKASYTPGDFIDRHGYFGCLLKGPEDWSIRDGYSFADRSALRFDAEEPGKPKVFANPVMDPSYDGKPSMISETTFNRPNRYRSEAPLFYAAYGALQDSDAIVHFAQDAGTRWSVQPNYFMQPWTLMTPAMMGQFPAAALIYRQGLVATGDLLADLTLGLPDLLALKGTPMPQDAALDELRLKDVPKGTTIRAGQVIDPLIHFAGRTNVNFAEKAGPAKLADLSRFIDRKRQTVTSSHGQLRLDYGKGLLTINAPAAQGISGALRAAGTVELSDLSIASGLELGNIVAVSLDGRPLRESRRILLQAMSEEKAAGFRTEPPSGPGVRTIASIGHDPWLVRELEGTVRLKRPDAARLRVVALGFNGEPGRAVGPAAEFRLLPSTIYYLIAP